MVFGEDSGFCVAELQFDFWFSEQNPKCLTEHWSPRIKKHTGVSKVLQTLCTESTCRYQEVCSSGLGLRSVVLQPSNRETSKPCTSPFWKWRLEIQNISIAAQVCVFQIPNTIFKIQRRRIRVCGQWIQEPAVLFAKSKHIISAKTRILCLVIHKNWQCS